MPELIYDGKSFYPVYCRDIEAARKNVLIVCPFMRKNRISQLSKIFLQAISNGAKSTVITRPPRDFPETDANSVAENVNFLETLGVKIKFESNFHQKFTIIDNKTVWYGSVNFLSFGKNEESIMRFTSFDIATGLEETITE